MPNVKRRPARLNIATRVDVAQWLRARANAEDVSVSIVATRILRAAMEADRERYGGRDDASDQDRG